MNGKTLQQLLGGIFKNFEIEDDGLKFLKMGTILEKLKKRYFLGQSAIIIVSELSHKLNIHPPDKMKGKIA